MADYWVIKNIPQQQKTIKKKPIHLPVIRIQPFLKISSAISQKIFAPFFYFYPILTAFNKLNIV